MEFDVAGDRAFDATGHALASERDGDFGVFHVAAGADAGEIDAVFDRLAFEHGQGRVPRIECREQVHAVGFAGQRDDLCTQVGAAPFAFPIADAGVGLPGLGKVGFLVDALNRGATAQNGGGHQCDHRKMERFHDSGFSLCRGNRSARAHVPEERVEFRRARFQGALGSGERKTQRQASGRPLADPVDGVDVPARGASQASNDSGWAAGKWTGVVLNAYHRAEDSA